MRSWAYVIYGEPDDPPAHHILEGLRATEFFSVPNTNKWYVDRGVLRMVSPAENPLWRFIGTEEQWCFVTDDPEVEERFRKIVETVRETPPPEPPKRKKFVRHPSWQKEDTIEAVQLRRDFQKEEEGA